jgi:TolA-binding protein
MDMSKGRITGVVLVAVFSCGVAYGQVPVGMGPVNSDTSAMAANKDISSHALEEAISALNAKNYRVAEGLFEDLLRQNPTHADANFMLGVTKMSLGKWAEAKPFLEVAVRKSPKSPDPKSRLGVTLAKLGDLDGAKKQRDDLVKMQKSCRETCRNAQWIDAGIAMIDGAAAPKS